MPKETRGFDFRDVNHLTLTDVNTQADSIRAKIVI